MHCFLSELFNYVCKLFAIFNFKLLFTLYIYILNLLFGTLVFVVPVVKCTRTSLLLQPFRNKFNVMLLVNEIYLKTNKNKLEKLT